MNSYIINVNVNQENEFPSWKYFICTPCMFVFLKCKTSQPLYYADFLIEAQHQGNDTLACECCNIRMQQGEPLLFTISKAIKMAF